VDRSELKPKSKKMEKESDFFNTFLVIFCEGAISPEIRNYIRFFPENSVIKRNIQYLADFSLYEDFHLNLRHFDHPAFFELLEKLLKVDYALLIQPDPGIKKKERYSLTHFHVKVDWPIADAAEDLARQLRYIQGNLYERGDREARNLQNKLFEYYGCHHSVGGRRTAGLIAAQLLRKMDFVSTTFVSSSESRAMYKYSERGISKFFLVPMTAEQIAARAQQEGMSPEDLFNGYLYPADPLAIGIAEASFTHTKYSEAPEECRIRPLRPACSWIKLRDELLHPRSNAPHLRPISYRDPLAHGAPRAGAAGA
jgi:hypothetical protein